MNYFNPYPLCVDDTVTTAWKFQVTQAATTPSLHELLAQRGGELFPRFASAYTELRALPRGARRALQRRLAHSRELSATLQGWLQQQSIRALQQKLACTLAGAALLLVLGRGVSDAATITVNTNAPGIVLGDNKCSLIEAIITANTDANFDACVRVGAAGEDTVVLPKKTFTLTKPYDTYYGDPTGLPLITTKITIEGKGAKITRSKNAPPSRLMAVGYTGLLELDKVTLSGGISSGYYGGGAIFNYGETTITNSTITGNTGYSGGGISNIGTLTLQNRTTISKNTAKGFSYGGYYYGGEGGGIVNYLGTLTITNSTITGNTGNSGGAIANSGSLTLQSSTISKNTAKGFIYGTSLYGGGGGGILNGNAGTLDISDISTVTANKAYYGGGIFNSGDGTITDSTISGNTAKLKTIKFKYYGTTYTYFIGGLGGGVNNSGYLTITNSTISGNSAKGKIVKRRYYGVPYTYFYAGKGGGIYNSSNLYLYGGKVTGNSATNYGGGIYNGGTLVNTSNVTGNKAKNCADVYPCL